MEANLSRAESAELIAHRVEDAGDNDTGTCDAVVDNVIAGRETSHAGLDVIPGRGGLRM